MTASRNAVLTAQGLTKVYSIGDGVQVYALRGVNIEFYQGELVVLLGPSGSGKSTLLNILGGLDVPTSGTVHYRDHNLTAANERDLTRYRREHVGFVFQFSLPLPLSDRQQGARAEARALAEKNAVERDATELRLRTALFGIAQELIHADTELTALDRDMLPDAEAALTLAREGFERARFSQLELLDAQRTLLELRRERIAAAVACHQFVIEIEKLLGEPLAPASTQPHTH